MVVCPLERVQGFSWNGTSSAGYMATAAEAIRALFAPLIDILALYPFNYLATLARRVAETFFPVPFFFFWSSAVAASFSSLHVLRNVRRVCTGDIPGARGKHDGSPAPSTLDDKLFFFVCFAGRGSVGEPRVGKEIKIMQHTTNERTAAADCFPQLADWVTTRRVCRDDCDHRYISDETRPGRTPETRPDEIPKSNKSRSKGLKGRRRVKKGAGVDGVRRNSITPRANLLPAGSLREAAVSTRPAEKEKSTDKREKGLPDAAEEASGEEGAERRHDGGHQVEHRGQSNSSQKGPPPSDPVRHAAPQERTGGQARVRHHSCGPGLIASASVKNNTRKTMQESQLAWACFLNLILFSFEPACFFFRCFLPVRR